MFLSVKIAFEIVQSFSSYGLLELKFVSSYFLIKKELSIHGCKSFKENLRLLQAHMYFIILLRAFMIRYFSLANSDGYRQCNFSKSIKQ